MTRYFYSGLQKLLELFLNMFPPAGEVLMFHQVDNRRENWLDENCCITCESFKLLIERLAAEGREFRGIGEIHRGSGIYITFDDGFADTYTNAYPVLKEYKIPFCIFVAADYIGRENYLTMDMLKSLASDPLCTIGSHSLSHPLLRGKSGKASDDEIAKSKYVLEQHIKRDIKFFAYPYGSLFACSARDIRNAGAAGYSMAFSTLNSHLSSAALKLRLFLPRVNVNEKNHLKAG